MAANDLLALEFDELTTLLAEHRWIFDFKLTRIFQDNVFDNTPDEWKEVLMNLSAVQLAELPFGNIQPTWPESLKVFIEKCMRFSLPREVTVSCPKQYQVPRARVSSLGPCAVREQLDSGSKMCSYSDDNRTGKCGDEDSDSCKEEDGSNEVREITPVNNIFTRFTPLDVFEVESDIRKGMSAKKMHEVCHMTSLIDHVTRVGGNNGVVDVGSGLGYLGQVLHCNYGQNVLGLEGKQGHTTGADRRLNKFECSRQLHNVTCELYQESQSQQEFMFLVKDWFSNIKGSRCSHQKTGTKTFQADVTKCPQTGCSRTKNQVTATRSIETDRNRCAQQKSSQASSSCQTGSSTSLKTGTQNFTEKSVTGSNKSECINTDLETEFVAQADLEEMKLSNFEVKSNPGPESESDSEQTTKECSDRLESYDNLENDHKCAEKYETSLNSDIAQLCMVGLHCCGDLTPTVLRYFVDLDIITSLCCVSCCYHRMHCDEGSQEHDNFPMSRLMKESVTKARQRYPDFKFSSYSLRLAAQETRARWREQTQSDHEFHTRNVAYRGLLDTCLEQAEDSFKLKKCVRKLAHKDDYTSFTKYTDAVFKHIQVPDEVSVEEFKAIFHTEMQKKYDAYHHHFCLIEPLTALQYLLQPVIESLIYLDRKHWLREQGYHAEVIPVFDELISPRNLALIACKHLS